jgi:hypothetical protein
VRSLAQGDREYPFGEVLWKGNAMQTQQINRISSRLMIALSMIALLTVMSGYAQPRPLDKDEGTAAHIFQLSVVALLPVIVVFFATANWKQPSRSTRLLAFPATALALAFAALYYLEHYW